jgi:hypothetical protein
MQLLRIATLAVIAIGLHAQAPTPTPVTHVMAILTVKDGVDRAEITKVLPKEVRDTVQLHLDGRIDQWYARGDGKGVVFILNAKTVDEAKGFMEALPLVQGKFASFDYMTLGPLSPLRILLAPPPAR